MTIDVLYAGNPDDWPVFESELNAAFVRVGLDVALRNSVGDPQTVKYIVYAPSSPVQDFTPFTNLKAVLNLWAGVENIQGNKTLTTPLARMVESGMTEGMAEWVLGHVMRHHLGMDVHILNQDGKWRNDVTPPLARQRTVGILGLGTLGLAAAKLLCNVGFQVYGWSRSQKSIDGVTCFSGETGLNEVLQKAEILVLLVPLTKETHGILSSENLQKLPQRSVIINPGRGPLIDNDALISALDSGQIAHATLDVFDQEPLPDNHPFWGHPKVTVTPHIASATRPYTSCESIAENIRRGQSGEEFLDLVDRAQGY